MPITLMLTALQQINPSWVFDTAGQVLIGQAVIGLVALVGLIAVLRRFLANDFPIAMKGVHDRLDTLHEDLKHLEGEFRLSILDLERLKERQEYMKTRLERIEQSRADDTQSSRRRRPQGE